MHDAEIGWIAAIIVGGLAGWLAEMFMKSGTGILTNILLGIVGAAVANFLLGFFGITLGGVARLPRRGLHRSLYSDLCVARN